MSRVQGTGNLDIVLAAQRPPETTQPISLYELEILFNCCCRFPTFFAEARQQVREHHFDQGAEISYALFWRSLCQVTDQYGGCNHETVTGQMLVYLNQLGDMMPEQIVNSIVRQDGQGLIWASMYVPADATTYAYGRDILQRFLHERTIVMPLRRLLSHGLNGSYATNLGDILEAVQHQQGQIASLQEVPRCLIAPDVGSPIEQASDVFKTIGMPWMDTLLRGHRVGDCNGLIGVIGGGKTTLAVNMAVASAKQSWIDAQRYNTQPEFNVFFTAEESAEKVLPRVRSCAFQIPRRKLAAMTDWGQLTTPANLDPYEHMLVASAPGGGDVLSETERWQINAPWLNQCLELLDVSGSAKFPHAGEGFVPELVANLDAVIRMRGGQRLRSVYIDWVGILVDRHMAGAAGADESKKHEMITRFINTVRRQIAERFGCTVWCCHQIRGNLLDSSPTKLFHHSHAAEATAFAAELAVCCCIGVPDHDTGCRRLNFSKVRYINDTEVSPRTIRIHPSLAMIEDVTDQFGVDEAGRRFALMSDLARTQGAEAATPRAQAGPAGMGRQQRPDPNDDVASQIVT